MHTLIDTSYPRLGFDIILSPYIAVYELCGLQHRLEMHPEEERFIAGSTPARVAEFSAARYCAKLALCKLGIPSFPLLNDINGSPIWPTSVVGSITHNKKYCAVAVGLKANIEGIGIDAEDNEAVDTELWPLVFSSIERNWLETIPRSQQLSLATVMFSAKEAFFKYQFPLTGTALSLKDIQVVLGDGKFYVTVQSANCANLLGRTFTGTFKLTEHCVLSAIFSLSSSRQQNANWRALHYGES